MYRAHFGLSETPFNITPNPAFFYSGNTRGAILDALLYAVLHGEGIVKVTGEVGSGKTMLCRMLESELPDNVVVIYLVNPSLTPEEVLYTIAGELSIATADKRNDELLRLLHADLIAKHTAGQQVVLLVEEAQAMPLETLEEIRLLTNLETAHHKLLQIVLFGQPELDANLSLMRMRQLRERITHSFSVPPMEAEVIGEYLAFRLSAAGYQGEQLFDDDAVSLIATVSQGIVRRINILADKALLAAFAEDAHTVSGSHVRAAVGDSPFGRLPRRGPRQATAIGVVVLLMVAALVWQLLQWTPQSSNAVATLAAGIPLPKLAAAPPATTAAAAPAVATGVERLLDANLATSAAWLQQEPPDHLVLQITVLPLDDVPRIESFLRATKAAIGLEKIHVYRFLDRGKASLSVVYGSFSTRTSADAVRAMLSEQSAYQPTILDVATVRRQAASVAAGTP